MLLYPLVNVYITVENRWVLDPRANHSFAPSQATMSVGREWSSNPFSEGFHTLVKAYITIEIHHVIAGKTDELSNGPCSVVMLHLNTFDVLWRLSIEKFE